MEKMIVNLQDVDITDTAMFAEYSDGKEQLKFELEHRQLIRAYLPPEIKARNEALSAALQKMDQTQLRSKAGELVKAQGMEQKYGDLIDHMAAKNNGDFNRFNAMWSPLLWQAREDNSQAKVSVGKENMLAYDLDFIMAESLQSLYASEDPRAEYHDWIDRQKKIEVDIYTDGTTEDEIVARNTFISFLDDRETELKRVIFLYAGAAFNPNSRQQAVAQEKLKFLTFKLSELRRLRERTANTKSQADEKEYFDKKERQQQREAVAATAGFVALGMTAEMVSLGNRRLSEQNDTASLEHGIGESFVRLRPETRTIEQAQQKIETARQNRTQMAAMFAAMRNGMSKEEWLEQQKNNSPLREAVREKVRSLHGFYAKEFKEYTDSRSA